MSEDRSQIIKSREFQLDQIRKLVQEAQSAVPARKQEIEAEIATRTSDIRNLEALLVERQGKGQSVREIK